MNEEKDQQETTMTTLESPLKSAADWAKEGWKKCTTHEESRLLVLKTEYEELGFEVMILPFNPVDEPTCTTCMAAMPERYKTLYIRPTE
jgi:hypothetical protein